MVSIAAVTLPQFGRPEVAPQVSAEEYRVRLVAAQERMGEEGLDFLFVYGGPRALRQPRLPDRLRSPL